GLPPHCTYPPASASRPTIPAPPRRPARQLRPARWFPSQCPGEPRWLSESATAHWASPPIGTMESSRHSPAAVPCTHVPPEPRYPPVAPRLPTRSPRRRRWPLTDIV